MTLLSRFFAFRMGLPPAETRDIVVTRDIPMKMPDGVVLLADHYRPRGDKKLPTILVRSPYGRSSLFGQMYGVIFAERGFQVLLQSCRGTFGSQGVFEPFRHEAQDGLATLELIEKEPWFSGDLAMMGASYLGIAQWAVASAKGTTLKALAPQVTSSNVVQTMYSGGAFWLDTALYWALLVDRQEKGLWALLSAMRKAPRLLDRATMKLPVRTGDEEMVGKAAPYYREWVDHAPEDPYWQRTDFSGHEADISAPVLLTGGFYDVFLPDMVSDYRRLREAGKTVHFTIGPWFHTDGGLMNVSHRESLAWFRAHLLGDRSGLRELPVWVYVMGAGEWQDFSDWPPPEHRPERHYLKPGGGLSTELPGESEPDRYRYDPQSPTPSVGGTTLTQNAGVKNQEPLLGRSDVLVYTSEPLPRDLEIIGPVSAELFVETSLEHTDFFVCLCDVRPSGKTTNVCDGLLRLTPSSHPRDERGTRKVTVSLWPTAYRFAKGHRIRVLVSSGAHPRFARNPGTGEPFGAAVRLLASDQAVHHDPERPSSVVLPVMPAR